MFTLKIIGCICVMSSCAGIGLYFSATLKERFAYLKELKKILLLLRGDIRYANTQLSEALSSISMRHKGEFRSFLSWVSEQMEQMQGKTIADIWKEGVEQKLKNAPLSKKDIEALISFGSNLGYLDKDMQLSTIDLYVSTLEAEIEETSRTMKEKSYLYNSLGIMAGVFIAIVLI